MMDNNMWQEVEDVLFDGTKEQILKLVCPECKSGIYFIYSKECNSLEYGCKECGRMVRATGCHQVPNCAELKG